MEERENSYFLRLAAGSTNEFRAHLGPGGDKDEEKTTCFPHKMREKSAFSRTAAKPMLEIPPVLGAVSSSSSSYRPLIFVLPSSLRRYGSGRRRRRRRRIGGGFFAWVVAPPPPPKTKRGPPPPLALLVHWVGCWAGFWVAWPFDRVGSSNAVRCLGGNETDRHLLVRVFL